MVNDDERRAVARRLREMDYADLQESLICAYLDALGIEGYTDWVGIAHRLADLIEPSGHECVPGECPLNVRHDNDRIDRDALLEEVKELEKCAWYFGLDFDEDEPLRDRLKEASEDFAECASRIREASGVGR